MKLTRLRQSLLLLGLLFFAIVQVYGQELRYEQYTIKDGLAGNTVYHVFSDSKGYLWFSTALGVSRFDGREFVNYTTNEGLPDNEVFILDEDEQGRIWFGTYSPDLSYLEGDSIKQFQFNDSIKKYIPERTVKTGFVFKNGSTYMTDLVHGLLQIDAQGNVKRFGQKETNLFDFGTEVLVGDLSSPKDKRRIQGFRLFSVDKSIQFVDSNFAYLPEGRAKGGKYCIRTGPEKYLLMKGDYIWHIGKDSAYYTDSKFQLDCIFKDLGGQIWIGTVTDGIHLFKDDLLTDTIGHLFRGMSITHISKDFEGGIWVSTLNEGVFHIPHMDYSKLNPTGLPPGDILMIQAGPNKSLLVMKGNGDIWMGGGNNWQQVTSSSNVPDNEPKLMKYVAGYKQLYTKGFSVQSILDRQYSLEQIRIRDDVEPTGYAFSVHPRDKDVLEIRGKGIHSFNADSAIVKWKDHRSIRFVRSAVMWNDTLFLSTNAGLYTLSKGNVFQKLTIPELEDKAVSQLIFGDSIRKVFVCLHSKILVIQHGEKKWYGYEHLLPIGITKCLLDEDGILWIGSQRGLFYLDLKEGGFAKKVSMQLGVWDERINDLMIMDSIIYIGSTVGLQRVKKSLLLSGKIVPPKIYIQLNRVNGERLNSTLDSMSFDHSQNSMDITLTSIAFTNRENESVEWKMGNAKTWSKITSGVITFSGLSFGNYRIHARSSTIPGIWSQEATYQFTILPAWWQRRDLQISGVAALLLLTAFAFYRRGKYLENKAFSDLVLLREKSELEIRALRAQMNPHFIFNSLTSIQYLINEKKSDEAEFYLNKFSRLLRTVVDRAGQNEMSLLEEINLLRVYIDLENLRYDNRINFNLEIDDDIDVESVIIPAMILQPFVENAIEHGLSKMPGKGDLSLFIKHRENNLEVVIRDNGIGRKRARELKELSGKDNTSIGVYNVRRRIDLLNDGKHLDKYHVEIIDLSDGEKPTGTEIRLKLPYTTRNEA
ncbi:MAG: histidine kinase [Vicingaceae bacterium]